MSVLEIAGKGNRNFPCAAEKRRLVDGAGVLCGAFPPILGCSVPVLSAAKVRDVYARHIQSCFSVPEKRKLCSLGVRETSLQSNITSHILSHFKCS